ncbi:MAG: hypothetical protein QNJ45_10800 [Ardenticatenaceae bacterium]|nr:hypothetical protein [Ardenticatenaceae bacterium]
MRAIFLLFILLLASASCTAADTPISEPVDLAPLTADEMNLVFDSPEYGVHISQWWDLYAQQRDLSLINEMDFGWVKQKFAWRDIEGAGKGEYDWYRPDEIVAAVEEAGLKLLVRIDRQPLWSVQKYEEVGIRVTENQPPFDIQDFGDFCGVMAERYRGRVAAYQVWNEPNLSREWGEQSPDPAGYVEMLKVCYEAIKEADPQAIVISAGLAPTGTEPPLAMPDDEFLRGMYAAGGASYFDVLGLNAPGYKAPPEISPNDIDQYPQYGKYRWHVFRHVEDMRRIMVEEGDAAKQIAILEMGWTTDPRESAYGWHAVSGEEQAEYLVGAYQFAAAEWDPWIGLMTTIFFADSAWTEADEQYWWSITDPDGTPRPAYEALKEMPKD